MLMLAETKKGHWIPEAEVTGDCEFSKALGTDLASALSCGIICSPHSVISFKFFAVFEDITKEHIIITSTVIIKTIKCNILLREVCSQSWVCLILFSF